MSRRRCLRQAISNKEVLFFGANKGETKRVVF